MSAYFVYVLQSVSHGTLYVGSTEDLDARTRVHNAGKCRYTKGRRPWELIYKEEHRTRGEARRRELFLKSGRGREVVKGLLKQHPSK